MQEHLRYYNQLFLLLQGPYGEGCHDWEASGDLLIDNDFTNGAYVYKIA